MGKRSGEAIGADARSRDVAWGEDFLWLLDEGDGSRLPLAAALDFVNRRRAAFQPACDPGHRIFFELVVKDHETADSPIMPAPALSATAADHVLPLSEITPLLNRCAAQSRAAAR